MFFVAAPQENTVRPGGLSMPLTSPCTTPSTRPICVAGMGRSGTSLTTAIIGLLGVELGPGHRMLPAAEHDNARGYWEQFEISAVNEEILMAFGGSWEKPPELPLGWEVSPDLTAIRERARRLLEELFGECEGRWAWKDPRTSATLPFWQDLIGEMDYVICVRNPADVAAPLARRGTHDLDFAESVILWHRYMRDALESTRGSRRLILRYEDYFADTERQIRRLADFVHGRGARVDEEVRKRIEGFIAPELWHNRDPGQGLDRVQAVSPQAADLYKRLASGRFSDRPRPIEMFRSVSMRALARTRVSRAAPKAQ